LVRYTIHAVRFTQQRKSRPFAKTIYAQSASNACLVSIVTTTWWCWTS